MLFIKNWLNLKFPFRRQMHGHRSLLKLGKLGLCISHWGAPHSAKLFHVDQPYFVCDLADPFSLVTGASQATGAFKPDRYLLTHNPWSTVYVQNSLHGESDPLFRR